MGGEDVGILGVVRALASAHYEPWLAVPHAGTYPSRSRACAGTDVVPDPRGGVDGFVEAIVDVAVRRQVRLVLPSTDVAVMELARHRDAFPEGIRLAVDPPEVVDAAMDKPLLSRLAREAGLAAPPGRVLAASEVGAADFEFDFPVAVKPLRSELRTPEGTLVRHRVSKAGDPLELRRALSALPGGRGLVERYLDGAVGGIAGVMWHGQLRGAVMVDARRMWPRDCGLFSYAVTAPSAPGFERAVETLLATLGVNGVFELDFVAHGGRRYVIDLNPRFFTSIALPVSAGLNLPAIWCDLLLGDAPVIPAHRVGARFRHEQNDIRALLDSAASGHPVAAVPGLLPHAGTAHALFSLRDPRPVLASIGKLRGHLKSKARRGPVTTTGDASPPAREWDELADRTGAPPFLRPGWLEAWWRAFGNGALEVTAVRRDGRLVAVMPLYRPGRRSAPYKVEPFPVSARRRTLRATANWHTPLHGPLAEDDEALEQLAAAVVGAGASLLSLGFPPGGVSPARGPAPPGAVCRRRRRLAGIRTAAVVATAARPAPATAQARDAGNGGRAGARRARAPRRAARRGLPARVLGLEGHGWLGHPLPARDAALLHRRRALGERPGVAASGLPARGRAPDRLPARHRGRRHLLLPQGRLRPGLPGRRSGQAAAPGDASARARAGARPLRLRRRRRAMEARMDRLVSRAGSPARLRAVRRGCS